MMYNSIISDCREIVKTDKIKNKDIFIITKTLFEKYKKKVKYEDILPIIKNIFKKKYKIKNNKNYNYINL